MGILTDQDYANLASRMEIEIISVALAHPPMLADVLARMAGYKDSAHKITITVREAERDGSITYIVFIEYINGGSITVGALRRSIDAETEYHS